jgi:endonuclease/exonuclease/phosphatase family metal-dependent hydrolase
VSERSPLAAVPQAQRDAILEGPRDTDTHARLLASLPFANALDIGSFAAGTETGEPTMNRAAPSKGAARFPRSEPQASGEVHEAAFPRSEPTASGEVHEARELHALAWNAERCKHLDESAAFLAAAGADVVLLTELDWGMARSQQLHTARELASRLGMSFAYGVEFLELDLGGERERSDFAGHRNSVGYHGNAILARGALQRPQLVRLETRGDWFDGARGEARVGGRCAVLAQVPVGGRDVIFAAVHLDSHGSPSNRADEMHTLLDAIDARDRNAPVVIGGDLNAFSLALADLADRERVEAALRDDPLRWSHPVPHEPLFTVAAERGYTWSQSNVLGESTLRHATDTGSARGKLKLDWFLCRGVAASAPAVIDAVGARSGSMLSDHEAIAISIRC